MWHLWNWIPSTGIPWLHFWADIACSLFVFFIPGLGLFFPSGLSNKIEACLFRAPPPKRRLFLTASIANSTTNRTIYLIFGCDSLPNMLSTGLGPVLSFVFSMQLRMRLRERTRERGLVFAQILAGTLSVFFLLSLRFLYLSFSCSNTARYRSPISIQVFSLSLSLIVTPGIKKTFS